MFYRFRKTDRKNPPSSRLLSNKGWRGQTLALHWVQLISFVRLCSPISPLPTSPIIVYTSAADGRNVLFCQKKPASLILHFRWRSCPSDVFNMILPPALSLVVFRSHFCLHLCLSPSLLSTHRISCSTTGMTTSPQALTVSSALLIISKCVCLCLVVSRNNRELHCA